MFNNLDPKKQAKILLNELKREGIKVSSSQCLGIILKITGQTPRIKAPNSKAIVLTAHELKLHL